VGKRRKGRELLVQSLYAAEVGGQDLQNCLDDQLERRGAAAETAAFVRPLALLIEAHRDELDAALNVLLENWNPERVGHVERAIFRLALAEMRYCPDVPTKVVIDEACELARLYCAEEAVGFVNGLLDRAARNGTGERA
jgi:N utilization substance protein B